MKLSCIMCNVGIGLSLVCGASARAGDIFVSDSGNGTVVRFDSAGNESIFASGLNDPSGLAFDGGGNLYVADSGAGTILKFSANGSGSVFASGLTDPTGLAFDGNGNLYVASQVGGTILRYSAGGSASVFASGLTAPTYLALGNLYVSTVCSIQEFDSAGNQSTAFSSFNNVYGLAADSTGDVYAALQNVGSIIRVAGSGGPSTPFLYPYAINPFELDPLGLAFDNGGNLYATFSNLGYYGANGQSAELNGVVMEFNSAGIGSIITTGLGNPGYIAVQNSQNIQPVEFVPEPPTWIITIAGISALLVGRSVRKIPVFRFQKLQRKA